jgi:CheY-like chemotaxis protein
MNAPPFDRELLDAFVPEFADGLDRLDRAGGTAAAMRVLDGLRPMVSALGLTALEPGMDAAAAAAAPFDPAALRQATGMLRLALHALSGAPPATPSPMPPAPGPGMRPVRTLLVDDSPTMRWLVRGILARDARFEVVAEAGDGAEALAWLLDLAPDLILLDLEMPVLDGFGFLRHWALAGCGAVVVVSSAAPPGSEQARALRRLGVAAVVGKPSGALSFDLADRRGDAILAAARRAAGAG